MAKTKGNAAKVHAIPKWQIAIIAIFCLLVVILLGYRVNDWLEAERRLAYFNDVDKIQMQANKRVYSLNQDFIEFRGDPVSAAKTKPKFKDGERFFAEVLGKLDKMDPPSGTSSYHRTLSGFYSKSRLFCSELYQVAGFVETRAKLLKKLSSSVETFSSDVGQAKSNEEILGASRILKAEADYTISELDDLPQPPILVYSNRTLAGYLTELSAALLEIDQGIESKDVQKIEEGASRMQVVLARDWSKTLIESDKEGLKKYGDFSQELQDLSRRAAAQRKQVQDRP